MYTSDSAEMFSSDLENVKIGFGQQVPNWSWLVNMLTLYQEYNTWSLSSYCELMSCNVSDQSDLYLL